MNRIAGVVSLALCPVIWAQGSGKPADQFLLHFGEVTLHPYGFLDAIAESRSVINSDNVSTSFGKFPLSSPEWESLGSIRHSRLMLKGEVPLGDGKFTGYMESDFMNFKAGQTPYRWRQYWGQAGIGKWEILGGQTWSLLRPNREGILPDRDLMNTDVIEPAYHVGLAGSRKRQIRISRPMGEFKAAVAWESDGNFTSKLTHDRGGLHMEVSAIGGRFGHRGISGAGVVKLTPKIHFVFQEFLARKAVSEALGVIPVGANGFSTIQGVEAHLTKSIELYSYGGLVYGSRSGGNRVVHEWTIGMDEKIKAPPSSYPASLLFSLQFSQLDRAVWAGPSGRLNYLMTRVRYTFN